MPKHCVPSTETSTSASQEIDPILLDVTDYTYDHSGNQLLTTRTTYTDGVAGTPVMLQSNTYDVWNQLIRTETENGTVVENSYNGDGRRVIKTVNGASTYYLYEYDKVILETNIYGDVTGRNVYGLNLLIRTVGVDTFYYMYNGHADVTALLTPSGTLAASYYYDAFGNILEQTGDVSNSILFAGYQYDKETGLYYLNARMYDPVTARFMQEDTFAGQQQDPLSLNLYTYCHNSPLMYWDPTGHYAQTSQGIQAEIDRLRETGTHNAGLWSHINALEAAKAKALQKEEDARKKEGQELTARYNNINSFIKDNPEFAEQDHVQSAMECATYMGTYTYLSVMESNIASWEEKIAGEQRANDTYNYVKKPQHANKSGVETNAAGKSVNEGLFLDILANTDYISAELQAFYQAIPGFYNAAYGAGESTTQCDCGGLARGIFIILDNSGLFSIELRISTNGEGGEQSWQGSEGRMTNRMFYATDTKYRSAGTTRYHSPFYKMNSNGTVYKNDDGTKSKITKRTTFDSDILQPGDIIYYDTNKDGCIDHAAIYVGETATGDKIIYETGTNSRVHFGYLEDTIDEKGEKVERAWAAEYIVGVKRYLPSGI